MRRDDPNLPRLRTIAQALANLAAVFEEEELRTQFRGGINIISAAIPMTNAVIHPKQRTIPGAVNLPITAVFEAMMIMITISGTATMPLTTALQNNAFIGGMEEY